jgi:signal peptide peptidase SppA
MTNRSLTLADRAVDLLKPILPKRMTGGVPLVPVVRLVGAIGMASPLRGSLSLSGVAKPLERAFSMRHAKAVALVINSPGGSPVQSRLIFQRIRDLATEHELPVYAFVEDAAASGGYMIACAADEIHADPSSIVGSIGVVGATFGFDKAMEKLGIDRRVYTAGEKKVTLDPFSPENPEDVARIKALQADIHATFIDLVKSRRTKLTLDDSALFTGEFWTGTRALEYGLIDGLGDLRGILRAKFGEDVATPLVSAERGLFGRRAPGVSGSRLTSTADLVENGLSALEARMLWSRLGL